ncbi:MAG: GNAT family N-acetyltransferase [Planctomycetaceae bacterium]
MLQVLPADPRTITPALSLLYGRWPDLERNLRVQEALQSVASQKLDLEHLVVACRQGSSAVLGAALAVVRPGREAIVWLPGVAAGESTDGVAGLLLTVLARRLDRAGVVCSVAFVDPHQAEDRKRLAFAGYPGIADLCLMQTEVSSTTAAPSAFTRIPMEIIPWSEQRAGEFARVIEQTQKEGSDCPEVGAFRTGDDVIASHASGAPPEPGLWQVYCRPGETQPSAILLLGATGRSDEFEIQYLGVVPEARRRGFARQLLIHARMVSLARGKTRLNVAVESRNLPALSLYTADGFHETRRYAIHLRLHPDAVPVAS